VASVDPDPVDHGLTRERTDLAWNRSGLAFVVCVAVLLRHVWPLRGTDQFVALACISVAAVAWALALSVGRTLWRRTRGDHRHLSTRRAAVITAGTVALALAAMALALLPTS
jgi:uncharacterized membrane protein YidH (DUF202 family)